MLSLSLIFFLPQVSFLFKNGWHERCRFHRKIIFQRSAIEMFYNKIRTDMCKAIMVVGRKMPAIRIQKTSLFKRQPTVLNFAFNLKIILNAFLCLCFVTFLFYHLCFIYSWICSFFCVEFSSSFRCVEVDNLCFWSFFVLNVLIIYRKIFSIMVRRGSICR